LKDVSGNDDSESNLKRAIHLKFGRLNECPSVSLTRGYSTCRYLYSTAGRAPLQQKKGGITMPQFDPLDFKRFEIRMTEGMNRMLIRAEEDHGLTCSDIIDEFFSSGAANGVDLDVTIEIGVHSRVYKRLTDYVARQGKDLNSVCLDIFRWFLLDW